MESVSTGKKPFLRGHFHQAAFFYALGASSMLVAMADSQRALIASLVYGLCLSGLFGISSLYHRIYWGEKARSWLKRLDHAMIFIFIAGTATPICMLALGAPTGTRLLWIFWVVAIVGVLKSLFWVNSPRWVSPVFYVVMGWLGVPYIMDFYYSLGPTGTALLVTGGVIYTVGAIGYALKRPRFNPKIFGYHEFFHILVIIASVFHFLVIYRWIATE